MHRTFDFHTICMHSAVPSEMPFQLLAILHVHHNSVLAACVAASLGRYQRLMQAPLGQLRLVWTLITGWLLGSEQP